jgi:hypothetical protein
MSLWQLLGGIGSIGTGMQLADDIRGVGETAAEDMGLLAQQLQGDTAFKGYGVTTGLGTSTVGADGTTNLGVGPDAGMAGASSGFMNASQQAMQNSMQDTAGREQDIYNRAMAMQQPGLDAQRAQHIAREQGMGRRGLMGSQFGGTGEDAAMARAQMQAMNEASFQSMGMAQNEMMNQGKLASQYGQLGQGMFGSSFMPMQQQMAMLGLGGQNADRSQTGQLTGANLASQLGLGGIQAQVNAETTAADLYAKLFGSGMDAIGGMDFGDPGGWF